LKQLRALGIREFKQLKRNCREYEQYVAVNYDYEIVKNEGLTFSAQEPKKSHQHG